MTTSVEGILALNSVDLTPFESRGAKPGTGNARTTGPVRVDGTYVPARNVITGSGYFDSTDSSAITAISIDAPYAFLTAKDLRMNDLVIDSTVSYTITSVIDSTSVYVDKNAQSTGTHPLTFQLTQREYLVEPDVGNNVTFGTAVFANGSLNVTGVGTAWLSELAYGDFIKHDAFQDTYTINQVLDNTHLVLNRPYLGDTTTGAYTASRVAIGRTRTHYIKNDFTFDNQSGKWKYDATTGSDVTTSASFMPFADGITLSYTPAYNVNNPGLMMTKTVLRKTFARQTQYDMDFFPLPVVPNPEASLDVYINNVLKDRYPNGNRDYVVNYSPNPVWETPPPPDQRKIANLMFLSGIRNKTLDQAFTESGQIQLTDQAGNNINGVMPGSALIWFDGTRQTEIKDYVLEPNSGVVEAVDYTTNEELVKYVAVDYSKLIDYGFSVFLNGKPQQISFPPQTTDDIIFQPRTGRFKPQNQDRPSPGDIYEFNYQVEGEMVKNELVSVYPGLETFRTRYWPIKRDSVYLIRNGVILSENEDYVVLYQTGNIVLAEPMVAGDVIDITYVPLSKQVNDLTYDSTGWFCTVHDSRLAIVNASNYQFNILNAGVSFDASTTSILRIYNETRRKDYNIAGAVTSKQLITLMKDSTNTSVGLSESDTVLIDYKFASESLEYTPVAINNYVVPGGSNSFYLEGIDATSIFPSNAILRLASPDSESQYYFFIDSAFFTGTDTKIVLKSIVPEDITNPVLNITDDPVSFLPIPLPASPVMAGASVFSFQGSNISSIFRPNTLIRIGNDLYSVVAATFDRSTYTTNVQVASVTVADYTDASELASMEYSDCPVYAEGETELNPVRPVISIPDTPGLIICQKGNDTLAVSSDSSKLTIGDYQFDYTSNPTLGDISSAIQASALTSLAVGTYIPDWPSRKISALTETAYIYKDACTVLHVLPELRLDGTDTTNFTITTAGSISLINGLVKSQRYNLDYMGRRFLGDTTVAFSADYFVRLPQKSKVQASFQYDNLDQFYIQVMSQKDFFETVSIPRMQNEASQLSGNAGQGGDVPTDEASGNSEGGIADDEYRRKDAEIECRVFKNIYDFFDHRRKAIGDEMWATQGLKMFNNDGAFDDYQQSWATSGVNRIFPDTDYTNFEPMKVNPLTGYFTASGAHFSQGSTNVTGSGTNWLKQLPVRPDSTCYIGRTDSTKRYRVSSVLSDTQLALASNFTEPSTTSPFGDKYVASASYPAYDDDGYMGPKIVGTRSSDFGLLPGITPPGPYDTFDCYIDGAYYKVDFTMSAALLLLPFPIPMFFSPPLMSAQAIASILTNGGGNPGLIATVEDVAVYPGTKKQSVIVLRTSSPKNVLVLGSGSAVAKLGFTPGSSATGNWDPTDWSPESYCDNREGANLGYITDMTSNEANDLGSLLTLGLTNKLNRITSGLGYVDDIHSHVFYETEYVETEISRLQTEITALSNIVQEPSLPSYGDATYALAYAQQFLDQSSSSMKWPCWHTYLYDSSLNNNWEDKTENWRWVTDWEDRNLKIRGVDTTGVAVDVSSGTGITNIVGQTSFWLKSPTNWFDLRIVGNFTYNSSYWGPKLNYTDGSAVLGHWTGWDPASGGQQSMDSSILFTLDDTRSLFVVQKDSIVPAPKYSTTTVAMNVTWSEDEGLRFFTLPYSTYPKVSSLMAAIDATPGFGCYALYNTNYDYTNLRIVTGLPLGGPPGVNVYTGSLSPAFSMWRRSSYTVTSTGVSLDGVSYSFASYTTLGDMSTAIENQAGYTVRNCFASDYPSGGFLTGSGDVSSSMPGTKFIFSGNVYPFGIKMDGAYLSPTYEATPTSLILRDGVTIIGIFAYSTYPTLSSLVTAVAALPGFDAVLFYNAGAYSYDSLMVVGQTAISSSSYTPVAVKPYSTALEITADPPTYSCDTSAIVITYSGPVDYSFPYSTYSTLSSLETGISGLYGMRVSGYFDPTLVFGYLETASGTVATSGPGTFIRFSTAHPIPMFTMFYDQQNLRYSVDSTALNIIWEEDSTTTCSILKYSSYPTIGSMKTALNNITAIDASGYSGYDSSASYAFKAASGSLTPDATIYPGLRECDATYATITDRLLKNRIVFVSDRSNILTARQIYLDTIRKDQITSHLAQEEILRTSTGDAGDLWIWANNRYNRRQGCEAKYVQTVRQIQSNQSALGVNKMFL